MKTTAQGSKSVAKCTDTHYKLPQISLPGTHVHQSVIVGVCSALPSLSYIGMVLNSYFTWRSHSSCFKHIIEVAAITLQWWNMSCHLQRKLTHGNLCFSAWYLHATTSTLHSFKSELKAVLPKESLERSPEKEERDVSREHRPTTIQQAASI